MPYLFYTVHARQPSICLSKLPSFVGVSLRRRSCCSLQQLTAGGRENSAGLPVPSSLVSSRTNVSWCRSPQAPTCLCPQRLAQSRPCSKTGAPAPPPSLLQLRHRSSSKPPSRIHRQPLRVHLGPSSRPPPTPRVGVAGEELGVGDAGELGTGGANPEGAAAPPPPQREASRAPAACAPWTGAWSRGARNRGA
jgi:hypothetical protein